MIAVGLLILFIGFNEVIKHDDTTLTDHSLNCF